ncbi:MAG: GNAT family N-acetyltransferase [Candidatus Entotheonellia bacterium]
MYTIQRLEANYAAKWVPQLVALLQDAVDSGASVGFLAPLSNADACQYWTEVFSDVGQHSRIVLAAVQQDEIVGSVQLVLGTMPNALHRAEVQKLLVRRSHRRHGIGRALMTAVEEAACHDGRHLLVLDTRLGDDAERLYARMGYLRVGVIPQFARSSSGTLDATVIFYRDLLA